MNSSAVASLETFFEERAGDELRSIIAYDEDDHELVHLRDDVAARYSDDELCEAIDGSRLESLYSPIYEDVYADDHGESSVSSSASTKSSRSTSRSATARAWPWPSTRWRWPKRTASSRTRAASSRGNEREKQSFLFLPHPTSSRQTLKS